MPKTKWGGAEDPAYDFEYTLKVKSIEISLGGKCPR